MLNVKLFAPDQWLLLTRSQMRVTEDDDAR